MDVTEIERAKIHEAGETKRKLIEEQEATKRVRVKELGPSVHVAVTVVILALVLGSAAVAGCYFDSKKDPARDCKDSVEVIGTSELTRSCPTGARVETDPLPNVSGKIIWKCVCGPRPVPGKVGGQ